MKLGSSFLFAVLLLLSSSIVAAETPTSPATTKTVPNQITISNYMFAPVVLSIVSGTKVTWMNQDEAPHTVVDSAKNKTFRSAALDTNDSYSYTFTQPGTYHYFCSIHPQMLGTIIVTAAK